MKRYLTYILIAIFTFNYAAMAYASPCAFSMDTKQASAEVEEMANMPNCHKQIQKQQQTDKKECKGICLCKHVRINNIAILPPETQSHEKPMVKNDVFVKLRHHDPFTPSIIDRPPILSI